MGEYAIRKRDKAEIKIGTCETMYYCRYDQLSDIEYNENTDNLFWRIPVPREDGIEVGDFEPWLTENGRIYHELLLDVDKLEQDELDDIAKNAGTVQAYVESLGMLINVPCYHGIKLPESSEGMRFFWNGKKDTLYMCALKNTSTELRIVVECRACRSLWSFPFEIVEPAIRNMEMKLRLFKQCSDYYFDHNEDYVPNYAIEAESINGGKVMIVPIDKGCYQVYSDHNKKDLRATWEVARDTFIAELKDFDDMGCVIGFELKQKYLTD